MSEPNDLSHLYCTFWVGGHYCAVPGQSIREVLRPQAVTKVPLAPPTIRGLINLRGQIIVAVDLRRRLSLGEELPVVDQPHVIVEAHGEVVSLMVDAIGDVLTKENLRTHSPPSNLPATLLPYIREVVTGTEHTLLVLDPEKVTDINAIPNPVEGTARNA